MKPGTFHLIINPAPLAAAVPVVVSLAAGTATSLFTLPPEGSSLRFETQPESYNPGSQSPGTAWLTMPPSACASMVFESPMLSNKGLGPL